MNVAFIPVRGGSKSIPLKNINTTALVNRLNIFFLPSIIILALQFQNNNDKMFNIFIITLL